MIQDHTVTVDSTAVPSTIHFAPVFNVAVPFIDRHLEEGRASKAVIRTVTGEVTYGELAERANRLGGGRDLGALRILAAAYAEAYAGRFDAELLLLHVIEPYTYNTSLNEPPVRPEAFDKFLGPDLRYLRVERRIEHGEPATKIVECAKSRNVDLIMLPTQGVGIFRCGRTVSESEGGEAWERCWKRRPG